MVRPSPSSTCRAGVRQQGHLAGVLDRLGDVTLVLGAVPGDPAGPDLAPVGNELPQQPGVLVVHVGDLLLAEQADFLPGLADRCFRHHGAPVQSPACRGDGLVCLIKGAGYQNGGGGREAPPPRPAAAGASALAAAALAAAPATTAEATRAAAGAVGLGDLG